MIIATLRELAKTLGCAIHQAEDVVRSEESARVALSRRGLFRAAGAVAAGSMFSFTPEALPEVRAGDILLLLKKIYPLRLSISDPVTWVPNPVLVVNPHHPALASGVLFKP